MSDADAKMLLSQMLEAVRQARVYVDGMTSEAFLADKRTQQAVTLNLIVIGEIATRLMDRHPGTVEARPSIEWRAMRGMRNRIAHGYYDIDMEIVWETVAKALPELEERLAQVT
jgi:uncharacterized protein with HEPN domain